MINVQPIPTPSLERERERRRPELKHTNNDAVFVNYLINATYLLSIKTKSSFTVSAAKPHLL